MTNALKSGATVRGNEESRGDPPRQPRRHYETVRQCKDRSLVDVSLTISPIQGLDGTIARAGKVEVSWKVIGADAERLKLQWGERDGRPVMLPMRTGFGSRMLDPAFSPK